MTLHVVHVVEATNAGVGRHVRDLVEGLARHSVRQTLVYSDIRADDGWRAAMNTLEAVAECVRVPMASTLDPVRDGVSIVRLAGVLRRVRPDVIHAHSGKAGLLGRVAGCSLPSARIVYTPHASPYRLGRVHHVVEKFLNDHSDAVIAVSATEAEELLIHGVVRRDRLAIIPYGVHAGHFHLSEERRRAERGSLGADGQHVIVGGMGRLAAQKAPLDFIEATAPVARANPNVRLVWIGDGELRADFESRARQLGLNVHITGFLGDVSGPLGALDVFCLTSRYEALSIALLEAMAAGLPCVTTRVAGATDAILEGSTGRTVALGDTTAMTRAVKELVDDPARRQGWGDRARDRIREHFTVDAMVRHTLRLYEELGALGAPTPRE